MMRFILIICFIVFYSNIYAQKAQFTVIYKVSFKPQKENDVKITEFMTLEINENQSRFYNTRRSKIDSLVLANNINEEENEKLPQLNFNVFKNTAISQTVFSANFNQFNYFFEEPKLSWKLLPGAAVKIRNFNIKQAETHFGNRIWIVQYTEDIPIPEGPYVFSGLPGLITLATSYDMNYVFELVSIVRNKSLEIIKIPKANSTKEKMQKNLKLFVENPDQQIITYKNIWGDAATYSKSNSSTDEALKNKTKILSIINEFNNPPDKNIPIINLFF